MESSKQPISTTKNVAKPQTISHYHHRKMKWRVIALGIMIFFYCFKVWLRTLSYGAGESNEAPNLHVEQREMSRMHDFHDQASGRRLLGWNMFNCTPQALENFPRDLFSDDLRRKGVIIVHVIISLYMFLGLAVVCDDYFVPCLECICEALKLQPDVAGATFMAAGSSAPELATTVIGVFIAKDDIGLGAVVGSADYNIMFVISVCALFAKSVIYLNWWPLVRDSTVYCLCIVVLVIVIGDEKVHWYEATVFLLLYLCYIALMLCNPKLDAFMTSKCSANPGCCPGVHHKSSICCHLIGQSEEGRSLGLVYDPVDSQGSLSGSNNELEMGDTTAGVGTNSLDLEAHMNGFQEVHDDYLISVKPEGAVVTNGDSISHQSPVDEVASRGRWADCFELLSWPDSDAAAWSRYTHALSLPIKLVLCLTTPNCSRPNWQGWYWLTFVMSCVWIASFSYIMIWMIAIVGHTVGIPDSVMGLTLIAAGSSVPDAIASILVVREGKGDMAVSNAVGSNIFDILVCMGLPWLLKTLISGKPIDIYSKGLVYATFTLLSTVVILLVATHLNRWRLTRRYGVVLMIVYLLYLILCTLYELNLFGYVHPPECPFVE